jgi:hypothetical protein
VVKRPNGLVTSKPGRANPPDDTRDVTLESEFQDVASLDVVVKRLLALVPARLLPTTVTLVDPVEAVFVMPTLLGADTSWVTTSVVLIRATPVVTVNPSIDVCPGAPRAIMDVLETQVVAAEPVPSIRT